MPTVLDLGLVERLTANQCASGAWGYSSENAGAAEPTALATIALAGAGGAELRQFAIKGAAWLAALQRTSGEVPVESGLAGPCWPTSLAIVAWLRCDADRFRDSIARAIRWLLVAGGKPVAARTSELHHDATLVGWAWVEGTHSWVEPTAYAMLALRSAGETDHPRFAEAQRLILDRAISTGGWNYGNSQVFGSTLRPFPETTGVALAALAGKPRDDAVDNAVRFLLAELPRIRSPLALGWGLVGLAAWGATPPEASDWLAEAAARLRARPENPQHDALLLLASAPERLLGHEAVE